MSNKLLLLAALVVFVMACGITNIPQAVQTVQTSEQTPAQTPTSAPLVYRVTANTLTVRECAGEQCTAVDWLSNGTELIVTGWDWQYSQPCKLWAHIANGWVCARWIRLL